MKRTIVSKPYFTFDQWIELGRHVRKGEKAHAQFPDGTAVFCFEQTSPDQGDFDDASEWDMF